jgi:hypothetical protein
MGGWKMNDEGAKLGQGATLTAIQTVVLLGREKFRCDFLGEQHCFDAKIWDLGGFRDRPTAQQHSKLYFTRHGTLDQELPPSYVEVIKSWIILEGGSMSTMLDKSGAARLLWEVLLQRRKNDPGAFDWRSLCEEDLHQAELFILEHGTPTMAYRHMRLLLGMTHFLAARSVCRPLYYVPQTPRPTDINYHTLDGQQARITKLPSRRALEGVAEIYHTHAKEPADRLRACALAILMVTGFRLGELLTLPLECEITEVFDGQERYGLRYYKEKARGAERMLDVRWLTLTGTELARKAIAEIRELTAPARERAKILEQHPHRVPIPEYQWADSLNPREVAKVLGVRRLYHIPSSELPRHGEKWKSFYRAHEVEAYLLSKRVERLWTLDRRDGSYQMLSETLLIAFGNGFHSDSGCLVNPLLVEPMAYHHLADFLTGRTRRKSVFERFGICEEDGTFCRITSHQFRHWLNDIADKGGLPVDLQTRWMGRQNPQDTQAYRHATAEERLQWLKNGIRNGEICGTMANVYFALPEEERDEFLEGQIQAVHVTPLGLCLHDFAIDPCRYYLNCARRCPEYLRTKGNQQERTNLIQVQRRTKQALEIAQAQVSAGNGEIVQAWIEHYEETLAGVEAALAIDDDESVSDGTMIQPFQGHPSRFQPL